MSAFLGFVVDGVIIGAVAETDAQALSDLCEVYGEHLADRYATACGELAGGRLEAVGDAPASVPGGHQGVGQPATSAVGEDSPVRGDEEGSSPAGDSIFTLVPPEGPAQEQCAICRSGVPADWASVSTEMYQEVRCMKCAA